MNFPQKVALKFEMYSTKHLNELFGNNLLLFSKISTATMNHDNDDNEDDDRVEHIHADDDSEGSGNNVNLDQMYSDFQQETLFMQPISREILLHHSTNDPT